MRISMWRFGALVDLPTGTVFPPPSAATGDEWKRWNMSPAFSEGSGVDSKVDSRLLVVKGGINPTYVVKDNVPDVYFSIWELERFQQLLFISGKHASNSTPA